MTTIKRKSPPGGSQRYGYAQSEYNNWNGVNLIVSGDAYFAGTASEKLYLVCVSTGTVKDVGGQVQMTRYSGYGTIGNSSPNG